MATLIKTTGECEEITPRNRQRFELEEAQKLVGGLIEIIYLGEGNVFVVNEEGKLAELPINEKATAIAFESRALMPDDYIVGDAIHCKDSEI